MNVPVDKMAPGTKVQVTIETTVSTYQDTGRHYLGLPISITDGNDSPRVGTEVVNWEIVSQE